MNVVFVQDYLVNILLETATKEHYEGARYSMMTVLITLSFVSIIIIIICFIFLLHKYV